MRIDKSNGQQPIPRNTPGTVQPVNVPRTGESSGTMGSAMDSVPRSHDHFSESLERNPSPKAYLGHYLVLGLVVAAVCAGFYFLTGTVPVWLMIAGMVLFLLLWVYIMLSLRATTYRLHADRLEIERGMFSRSIENIDLFRVRDVGLRQTILGRLLNFGTLYVHSTDSSTPDLHIQGIDDPRGYYQAIRDRVGQSRAGGQTLIVEQGGLVREP